MLKKIALLLTFFLFAFNFSNAGPAYAFRVKFKDKNGTLSFADSLQFLSQKALTRRSNQGIALDSTDLPVVQSYINSVMSAASAVKLHNKSKWFNQIVVITYDSSNANIVAALPIVENVKLVAYYANGVYKTNDPQIKYENTSAPINKTASNAAYYGLSFQQIDMLETDCLHDKGYWGEGMDIAVFDVNFRYTDVCNAFDSLLLQNRLIDVHDFVKDTNYVFNPAINNEHGMNVLSCMASVLPNNHIGTAPHANYYLYMSEDNYSEQPIEEDNWLSAAERADSIGVWLVNSSLGYNSFDSPFSNSSYSYADLTGHKTLISNALNKLASKGVLVVQAQGNEGASPWHYMLTPGDADSAYSVGSVDGSGAWASSGYGPNASNRIKPDGVALGKAAEIVVGDCSIQAQNGSSFASPIMCGSIACFWQSLPTKTSWEIRQLVRMSSDRFTNPNDTHGYGMPNFCKAYDIATGISDIQNIDYSLAIYPNPTQNDFYLKSFDNRIQNYYLSIYDLQGNCILKNYKMNASTINCNALQNQPNGEYILLISTPEKIFTSKISKK